MAGMTSNLRDSARLSTRHVVTVGATVATLALVLWYFWANDGFVYTGLAQTRSPEPIGEIVAGVPVAQTFTAKRDGLVAVELQLATYRRRNTGTLVVEIVDLTSGEVVTKQVIDAASVVDNAFREFRFGRQRDSAEHRYRITLEAPQSRPGNALTVWYDPGDPYPLGSAEKGGTSLPGDLAFKLKFGHQWRDLISYTVDGFGGLWPAALWVLLLATSASFALLFAPNMGGLFSRAALVTAAATAVLPLVLLWLKVTPIRLGAGEVRLGLLATAAIYFVAIGAYSVRSRPPGAIAFGLRAGLRSLTRSQALAPALVAVGLVVLLTWSRLLVVRDFPVGMWNDSYHHTIIALLISEQGRLPDSWLPYAPLRTLTYHFGFHAVTAFFSWATGIDILRSVVIVGQLVNLLAVIGCGYLALALTGRPWAGVLAILAAGFLSPMPEYYVNWGRYTQLAGQAILPFAMVASLRAFDRGERRVVFLAALLVAGIAVTHFRVLAFYILFVGAYLAVRSVELRRSYGELLRLGSRIASVGALAVLASGPWLYHQLSHQSSTLARIFEPPTASRAEYMRLYNQMGDFAFYLSNELMVLSFLGLVVGLATYRRAVVMLVVWSGALMLLANPQWLRLPGEGFVNNFAVQIALYLPVAVVAAVGLGKPLEWLVRCLPGLQIGLAGLVIMVGVTGAGDGLGILEDGRALVRAEDLPAMQWIRDNTPADARFLVNCVEPPASGLVEGTDAGWWLPVLARRANTVPPMNYNTEDWLDPAYGKTARDLCRAAVTPTANESLALFRSQGVTHVYIGAAGGVLRADTLRGHQAYEQVYEAKSVSVFRLR